MAEKNIFSKSAEILFIACIAAGASLFFASKTQSLMREEGGSINIDDAGVPEILSPAENCESPYTQNEIISAFKENDLYYKSLLEKTIDSRNIKNIQTVYTDSRQQIFVCSGVIEIAASDEGFRPSEYSSENPFFNKSAISDDDLKMQKFTIYSAPVIYTSEMTEEGNRFQLNSLEEGAFSCLNACSPVYKFPAATKQAEPEFKPEAKPKNNINIDIQDNTGSLEKHETEKPQSRLKRFFNFFRRNK